MELKFRALYADEIECRVGTISAKGFSLLLYKNARVDMQILDETVGVVNWQRDHKELKGNIYCGVAIWNEEKKQWITKWDCGAESNTEKEKGEASDSFKRACVNWGIGRELYTAPFIYIHGNTTEYDDKGKKKYEPVLKKIHVSAIEYKNGEISMLEICSGKNVIYSFGKDVQHGTKPQQPASDELTLERAYRFKTQSGKLFGDLPDNQLEYIVEKCKGQTAQAAKLILEDRRLTDDMTPIDDDGDLPF